MKEIPFIVPPEDEQKAIVEYIPKACAKYDAAISRLTQEVLLLEEFKTRLISDVVTGQIDVRGIEIPDYEYVEEESDEESDDMEGADEEAEEQEE
jgi:type I restriction enzyme S subunit